MELLNRAWVRFVLAGAILALNPLVMSVLQAEPGSPVPPLAGWQVGSIVIGLASVAAGLGILIAQVGLWGYVATAVYAIVSVEVAQAIFPGKPMYQVAVFIVMALVLIGGRSNTARAR